MKIQKCDRHEIEAVGGIVIWPAAGKHCLSGQTSLSYTFISFIIIIIWSMWLSHVLPHHHSLDAVLVTCLKLYLAMAKTLTFLQIMQCSMVCNSKDSEIAKYEPEVFQSFWHKFSYFIPIIMISSSTVKADHARH